jgi:hypothetical protein
MSGPDLPAARGEVSELLFDSLQLSPRELDAISLPRNHDSLADDGDAVRRLGPDDPRATAFFDEHVEADAVHESVAAVDLAGGLARDEPGVAGDILFGARALIALEGRWAAMVLEAWDHGSAALVSPAMTVGAPA